MSKDDFPMICENCLPKDKYLKMKRARNGEACKLCDKPFDVYRWKIEGSDRMKKTNICLSCAKVKNLCQCCMKDLDYDVDYYVRDAAISQISNAINLSSENDVNNRFLLERAEQRLLLTGSNDYDKINIEKVINKLENKYNYDSNLNTSTTTNEKKPKDVKEIPKDSVSVKLDKKRKKKVSFL